MKRLFAAALLAVSGFAGAAEYTLPVDVSTWTQPITGITVGLYLTKGILPSDTSKGSKGINAYVQQANDFSQLLSANFPKTANTSSNPTPSTAYAFKTSGSNPSGGTNTTVAYGAFGMVFNTPSDAGIYAANLRSCAYSSTTYCSDPNTGGTYSTEGDGSASAYYNYAVANPAQAYNTVQAWINAGRPTGGTQHQTYTLLSVGGETGNGFINITMAIGPDSTYGAGGTNAWTINLYQPGQAPSAPAGQLPTWFQDSLSGWAYQMPTKNYLTDSPALSLDTLRIHIVVGLAAYAETNGLCPSMDLQGGTIDTSTYESCIQSAFNMLPSNQWLVTPTSICITEPTGNNPQCVDVYTYQTTLSGVCPNGYGPADADGTSCVLTNSDLVHTNAGWGCRIYKTSAGLYQANPNDDDCVLMKMRLAQVNGGINMQDGDAIITWNAINNSTQTQLTYQVPVQANQNFEWQAVVDNATNKVLSIASGNYAGPPPALQGTPGDGVGLDGGAAGGLDPNGNPGLSPGYGAGSTGKPSFNPGSSGSGGSGSGSGNGATPPSGGASAPNGASNPVTSGPPNPGGLPDGTPSYLKQLLGGSIPTSSSCPANFFQLNLGHILNRDFIISDSGTFCQVIGYFQEFLRLVNIGWGYVYGIVIILSA